MKFPLFQNWSQQRVLASEAADDAGEVSVVQGGKTWRMSLEALRDYIGGIPSTLAGALLYTAQTLTSAQRKQARANIRAQQDLRDGRTLTIDDTIVSTDYGKVIVLDGFELTPGAGVTSLTGGMFAIQGPGTFVTQNFGTLTLAEEEFALIHTLADGDDRVIAVNRARESHFTYNASAPSSPVTGDEWYVPATGVRSIWDGDEWVEEVAPRLPGYTSIGSATGANYNLPASKDGGYIRKSHTTAVPHTVTIMEADGDTYAYPSYFTCRVRNTSVSGDLTIQADGGVTFNFATGANVLAPRRSATLVRVGLNLWDLD